MAEQRDGRTMALFEQQAIVAKTFIVTHRGRVAPWLEQRPIPSEQRRITESRANAPVVSAEALRTMRATVAQAGSSISQGNNHDV